MKIFKGILYIILMLLAVLGVFILSGWILSLILNPILLHFGVKPITPILGALIIVLIDWLLRIIKK